jgi:hypothetical protein
MVGCHMSLGWQILPRQSPLATNNQTLSSQTVLQGFLEGDTNLRIVDDLKFATLFCESLCTSIPETDGAKGSRTPDLLNAIETRYQLRYSPELFLILLYFSLLRLLQILQNLKLTLMVSYRRLAQQCASFYLPEYSSLLRLFHQKALDQFRPENHRSIRCRSIENKFDNTAPTNQR